jgi:hypothetical protein
MKSLVVTGVVVLALGAGAPAFGQTRPGAQRGGGVPRGQQGQAAPAGVTPAELQRMFDAMVLMQAQDELQLTDEQYPPFLTRLRALQDVRRRHLVERQRALQQLRRMTAGGVDAGGEAAIQERLRELDEIDTRFAAEIRKAVANLDQVLNVRQQARFRLFEEQVERRKVDLLTRARQANRSRP